MFAIMATHFTDFSNSSICPTKTLKGRHFYFLFIYEAKRGSGTYPRSTPSKQQGQDLNLELVSLHSFFDRIKACVYSAFGSVWGSFTETTHQTDTLTSPDLIYGKLATEIKVIQSPRKCSVL